MRNNVEKTHRRWDRSSGIFPCWVMPHQRANSFGNGAVINIGRGGLLLETELKFGHGDRMTLIARNKIEIEGLQIDHDIHGTVRWGLSAASSLMGLYYFGVELDEVLPLQNDENARGNFISKSYLWMKA